jgi:hypothetical protein
MDKIEIEINFVGLFLFFCATSILAILAGVVNVYLGITAFICATVFIIVYIWIAKKWSEQK